MKSLAGKLVERLRHRVRRLGFDLVRYPHPGSLGALLKRLFPRLGIACVLDVGAHTGEYGRFLRDVVGYRGHIVSFEPQLAAYEALTFGCRNDPLWTAHRMALGEEDGDVELQVARQTTFSSLLPSTSYAHRRFGDQVEVERTETVPVRRLDGLVDDLLASPGPWFLKIDVQGSERAVLEGAEGCLSRIAALQAEVAVRPTYQGAPRLWDLLAQLEERRYRLAGLFPVSLDRTDLSLVEMDAVAIRTDGACR